MRHRANVLAFPLADTGLQGQVALVVSMVPFNAFLKETISPCWLLSSFVVKHEHVQSWCVVGGVLFFGFWGFFAYFYVYIYMFILLKHPGS